MSKYQPYYDRFKRKSRVPTQVSTVCIALFLLIGTLGLGLTIHSRTSQSLPQSPAIIASVITPSVTIAVEKPPEKPPEKLASNKLSNSDKRLYKKVFDAQKSANWKLADKSMSKLNSSLLLGDVLAERYLHRKYRTSRAEIINWLEFYSDHQQAADIVGVAKRKYPELRASLPKLKKRKSLRGYGDTNTADIRFKKNLKAKKLWLSALEAWRVGKKAKAAKLFSELTKKKKQISGWQYSAANFWAYRSYLAIGEKEKATKYLYKAASNSRVFYGILARKKLNKPLDLDTKIIKPQPDDIIKLKARSDVKRVMALAESGLNERAEKKIRSLYPHATKKEKWAFLSLSSELNLASLQITIAKQLETNSKKLDTLKYPVPMWKPVDGFNVDPSLLYALMRQESGFHQSAISSGGALGLMQLMPKTAISMKKPNIDIIESIESVKDPVLNITLGERYVQHLLGSKTVKGNLLYMLSAYNAGPGRLRKWKRNIVYNNDPLLFVESIPYTETRYYVMKVMTNYWIYSELVGVSSKSIISLLRNKWPNYSPLSTPIADAGRRGRNG